MIRPLLAITIFLLSIPAISQHTVHLHIESLPSFHSPGSDLYIAGSFNGWNPQNTKYQFQKDKQGNYFIELKISDGIYEYKITRGGWDKVECQEDGSGIENRLLKITSDTTIFLAIKEWADRFSSQLKQSTASKNVHIIDSAFVIPQLKRIRRIWIYLPEKYESSGDRYPVLYMQDGQNLFDNATAFAGEWGVDEFLDSIKLPSCIIVGVDHGGDKRLNEYNPYDNDRFGKGEGGKYVDFLVKTLKPFIDKNYRTLKDKDSTFIAGSSMGGLISMYAVLKYPGVFGGAGVFSPSFWITGNKIFGDIKAEGGKVNSKIYFYAGQLEDENMVADMQKVYEEMKKVSKSAMKMEVNENGKHNEPTWRKEFPGFYQWLIHGN